MAERQIPFSRPMFHHPSWEPFRDWTSPSLPLRLPSQDFGMGVQPGFHGWEHAAMQMPSWPAYTRSSSFLAPMSPAGFASGLPQAAAPLSPSPAPSGGVGASSLRHTSDRWRVSLDVNHFSPEELVVKTAGRYVEISGRHEERQDEHGFVSRCFTRKYMLPPDIEADKVTSSLSADGLLTVEAALPAPIAPCDGQGGGAQGQQGRPVPIQYETTASVNVAQPPAPAAHKP